MPEKTIVTETRKEPIDGVVTGYYEQDGYIIHYEIVGHGDCIVFMFPGSCGNARADFGPILDGFDKDKFTIVAWDSPGFGLSRPAERDYKRHAQDKFYYEYEVETAVKLMNYLGYDSFSVMGWSDGGKSALLFPILFPAKVEKLVVWATVAYMPEKFKPMWKKLCNLDMWEEDRRKKYIEIYGSLETLRTIWDKHVDYYLTTSDICKNTIKNIRCPTFLLNGKKDPLIPKELFDHLVTNIPDVETHIFPDGVHDFHLSHAEKFNKLVQQFLLD